MAYGLSLPRLLRHPFHGSPEWKPSGIPAAAVADRSALVSSSFPSPDAGWGPYRSSERLLRTACHLLVLVLSGCSLMPGSTSSGLMIDGSKPALPAGVPKKVAVASFSGEFPINVQSADQFSSGLVKLGFDVVERQHFDKVVKEIELQHSGMISDENITAAGKQLGVDGLFVGSVEGRSKGGFVNTFLNLRLVEIKTGKVVWAGSFSDPRIFALTEDVKTSIIYTTKEALEKLESDLRSVRG